MQFQNAFQKKIKSAVTDSDTVIKFDPENKPGLANLMTIYSVFAGKTVDELEKAYEGKMYGHLKVDLADLVVESLKPVQEKYHDLMKNEDYLHEILKKGAQKARERASATLKMVYEDSGLVTFK